MTIIKDQPVEISTIDLLFEPLINDVRDIGGKMQMINANIQAELSMIAQKTRYVATELAPYQNIRRMGEDCTEEERDALRQHLQLLQDTLHVVCCEHQLVTLNSPMVDGLDAQTTALQPRMQQAEQMEKICEQGCAIDNLSFDELIEYRAAYKKTAEHMAVLDAEMKHVKSLSCSTHALINDTPSPADAPFHGPQGKTTVGAFIENALLQLGTAELESDIYQGTRRDVKLLRRLKFK